MTSIKQMFSRLYRSGAEDGITVTPGGTLQVLDDSVTLMYSSGGRHRMTMKTSEAGGICVRVESSEPMSSADVDLVTEQHFALAMAHKARELFQSRIDVWRDTLGSSRRSRWPAALAGFLAGAVFVIVGSMMMSPQDARQVSAGEVPANPASALLPRPDLAALASAGGVVQPPSAAPAAQRSTPSIGGDSRLANQQVAQARLTGAELNLVGKATSIKLIDGPKLLTAFSDPLCPACQDLERQAGKMGPGYGFSVIPVAYQGGARSLVASILCSASPPKAWIAALNGERPTTPACDAGFKQVDANNELFSKIGASATPTVIAPNGQLAQGSADTPELMQFVTAFAKQ